LENIVCADCKFETTNKKIYANHVRWKHKEKPYSDGGYAKLCEKQPLVKRDCICPKCQTSFSKELENGVWRRIDREQGGVVFCSRKCANSRELTVEIIEKIKKTMQEVVIKRDPSREMNTQKTFECSVCTRFFSSKTRKLTCSTECLNYSKKRKTDDLQAYRISCKFKFSLNDYPEEFDFSLIKEHGWYSASNRGNNPDGVSRDHMVSVKFGYLNKIDPALISHPANCRLILQKDNFKKRESCFLTLDELKDRIKKWDEKYGDIAQLGEQCVCNA
jgi:hypothetical protein